MKRTVLITIGLVGLSFFVGCASLYSSQVPMTRMARSSFQPFKSDAGDSSFFDAQHVLQIRVARRKQSLLSKRWTPRECGNSSLSHVKNEALNF